MNNNESEKRPWGSFEVLSDCQDHKVKRIIVSPKSRLSLQRHRYRREHWFIVSGEAEAEVDNQSHSLQAGESINIPLRAVHRIKNTGLNDLVFIEVQTGESFDEDDIERLEDDYGRLTS